VRQPHVSEMLGTPRAFEPVVPRHVAPVSLLPGLHSKSANSRRGRVKAECDSCDAVRSYAEPQALCSALAQHDGFEIVSQRGKKRTIVRRNHDRARISNQGLLKCLLRFDLQVVGGFVE